MKTKKYELVELIVAPNTTSRQYFQDIPSLRKQGLSIDAIESFSVKAIPTSPTGNPVVALADFKIAYLVLSIGGNELVKQIPLVAINRMQADPATANYVPSCASLLEFENLKNVDWSKSYVQFAAAPAVTTFSCLFGVHYTD